MTQWHNHPPEPPQPTHSLLTLCASSGKAKAFCQRMLGFFPEGRVMFLLLRICRRVLEGRRSEIITAPVLGPEAGPHAAVRLGDLHSTDGSPGISKHPPCCSS